MKAVRKELNVRAKLVKKKWVILICDEIWIYSDLQNGRWSILLVEGNVFLVLAHAIYDGSFPTQGLIISSLRQAFSHLWALFRQRTGFSRARHKWCALFWPGICLYGLGSDSRLRKCKEMALISLSDCGAEAKVFVGWEAADIWVVGGDVSAPRNSFRG